MKFKFLGSPTWTAVQLELFPDNFREQYWQSLDGSVFKRTNELIADFEKLRERIYRPYPLT